MVATSPSGTVTFLFTDIEGSTKLWERFPEQMKRALAHHDEVLRAAIEAHSGYVIKTTGDGFHAAFETGIGGVSAALAAQQALLASNWGDIGQQGLKVRIGLHTGEAEHRAGDYYGTTLNRAARLMSVAHGGQTLLSVTTADLVRDQLPPEASLRDLGEHRLKDLVRSERLYQLIHPSLPSEFPPLRSIDAYPNNLPVQLTTFIGRDRELEEAKSRLASARLLTLIGPGGTGKTRLALQLAADLLPRFRDGVWVAELAPITDASLIIPTVASVFGLREQQGMPIEELLIDFLRAKELLLVVDNCEHLVEPAAQFVEQLLHSCSSLKIVASSREALGIVGETVYRVPSLSLPSATRATRAALAESESVQLFVERAAAANPKFALSDQNAAAIAQICRRLDGIPLALELAASRLTVFTPEQVASRLDDRFRLLTGGSRTALPRQQTLRALIDWSYDLLSEPERKLFRKFSVFAGGCTYEAAEAICSEMDVLNLLTQLVNKSLVAVEDENGSSRYRLLETVRQYARDKLLESGESESARNIHFDYFYNLAKSARDEINGPNALQWVSRLIAEYDNIRAALEWGLEQNLEGVLRMIGYLSRFWIRQGYEGEARQLIRDALGRAERSPMPDGLDEKPWKRLLGEAWGTLAMLAYSQGDNDRAIDSAAHAAKLAREVGDKEALATVLAFQAASNVVIGRPTDMIPLLEEAVTAARLSGNVEAIGMPLGMLGQVYALQDGNSERARDIMREGVAAMEAGSDRWVATMGLLGMAMIAKYQGNYEDARERFSSIAPTFRDLGDRHRSNMVKSELGHIDRYEGHYDKAEAAYRETILEWQRLGHRAAIAHQLECFAFLAEVRGDNERAARLYGAAEGLREKIAISMTAVEKAEYEQHIADLRAACDAKAFAAAWSAGRAMSMEQAIAYALEKSPAPPRAA